jgi:uncharacterized membrane protein
MTHLKTVEVVDDARSHWVAKAPIGGVVDWTAEVSDEEPNRFIAWRALEPAAVPNEGRVSFTPAPGGRGTEVKVTASYRPPAGRLGVGAAKVMGEAPDQQVREDLRRLKQILEAGEIIRVDGQPSGASAARRRTTALLRRRPATGERP